MTPPPPFPSVAPYRIDQVTTAPLVMTLIFLVQLLLAGLLTHWQQRPEGRGWRVAALALIASVVLFFTLASWGNSDTTKLSHDLAFGLERVRGEPFWALLAPLIVGLPYRMALVHGLVAGGYAALAILLSRHWRCPAWGGWWALLLCCSPLLRNFLQNGVSRQALLTLLLVPLMLWAGRLARPSRWGTALSTLGAATVHSAFAGTLLLALLPRALAREGGAMPPALRSRQGPARRGRLLLLLLALALLLVLAGLLLPVMLSKLAGYTQAELYFNRYPLSLPVERLLLAMALGVLLVCWRRRLGLRQLLACPRSRVLLLFALLYALLQLSIRLGWYPQITSRFADPLGLFLMLSWLAWLERYRSFWAVLPALLITLEFWLVERLLASHTLRCGRNDEFLCVPDRWPWLVRY